MMEERYPQLEKPYQQPTSAEIVRTFKAASTRHIRVSGRHDFAWQEKYWGELILDDNRFNVVSNYIRDNPRRWEKDKLYKPEA
jgi:putative transposase